VSTITIPIDTNSIDGYNLFIKCKKLPRYDVIGNLIRTDEKSYNYVFNDKEIASLKHIKNPIEFDYQGYVVQRALEREKYAAFLDCGLGKTIIELMFIHDVINQFGGKGIFWCPLSVLEDVQRECLRLYGYRMSNLRKEEHKTDIAIINYESMRELNMKDVSAIVLDESSILKSGDGAIADYLTRNACNVKWRLDCSATPSPNDQTEYASHAVHLGICNTQKEFYSRFFVKDGTEWRMKNHAKGAFYDFLKSWACYIQSPSSIGFEQGAELKEDPEYIIQESYPDGDFFEEGKFLADTISMSGSSKIFTNLRCDKNQDRFKNAIESIENKQSIIWCNRNKEEELFAKELKATQINGNTPIEKRVEIIDAFKSGQIKHICSKPSVLGFGVNIQEAEAHLYSGYNFSFEEFYQAVRRSHRYGRKGRLKVYVPVSEPERPIWNILNRKLQTFKNDVIELQKRFFN
jgi:hypothetical protein